MFRKLLHFPSNSIATVLHRLHSLFGCVYLKNSGQDVIAFLPEKYCISTSQQYQTYTRSDFSNYKKDQNTNKFDHFFLLIHSPLRIALKIFKEVILDLSTTIMPVPNILIQQQEPSLIFIWVNIKLLFTSKINN